MRLEVRHVSLKGIPEAVMLKKRLISLIMKLTAFGVSFTHCAPALRLDLPVGPGQGVGWVVEG